METVSAAQEDTVNANPSSVKSDDSSPRAGSGRGSPPPNCAICLGQCKNKSFTDSCLHQFCFNCLLTWSKVKAECPLCKQTFKSIIHNVRSNHQYEEYMVEQRAEEVVERIDIDDIGASTRRFRYRTTLTLPRRQSLTIQQFLLHYPALSSVFAPPAPRAPPARRRRSPASFRRTVYRHNLWARPLPDFTGRFRDCSPDFYRYNDAQMHRLVPWLNRELHYLLNENIPHISYVLTRILELLPQYHINSTEFREALHRYFGDRTEHFLHELHCFASTPYDLTGYDRNVQYTTDPRMSTMVNEVISDTESGSGDSDIVMVSHSEPAAAGPSRPAPLPAPVYPRPFIPQPTANDSVIPIETISHSDTDDSSSEVMVVGYIKPPAERTPEVVDLLGSDSDVVLHEPQPGPSSAPAAPPPEPAAGPLVKLSLKRHVPADTDSDSSGAAPAAGALKARKRRRSSSRTWSGSASPASSWSTSLGAPSSPSSPPSPSSRSSPASCSTTSYSFSDAGSTPSRSSRKERTKKKKTKKKSSKKTEEPTYKEKDKKKKKKTRKRKEKSPARTPPRPKKSKKKSRSDKDVKRSKRSSEAVPPGGSAAPEQAGPSGGGGGGGAARARHKPPRPRRRGSASADNKRLKSVVKVMNPQTSDTNSNLLNILSDAILNPNSNLLAYNSDSGSIPSDDRTKNVSAEILERAESCFNVEGTKRAQGVQTDPPAPAGPSDSEDDLPLNLTMRLPRNHE